MLGTAFFSEVALYVAECKISPIKKSLITIIILNIEKSNDDFIGLDVHPFVVDKYFILLF